MDKNPLAGWKGIVTTKIVAKSGEQKIVLQSNSKTSYYYESTVNSSNGEGIVSSRRLKYGYFR